MCFPKNEDENNFLISRQHISRHGSIYACYLILSLIRQKARLKIIRSSMNGYMFTVEKQDFEKPWKTYGKLQSKNFSRLSKKKIRRLSSGSEKKEKKKKTKKQNNSGVWQTQKKLILNIFFAISPWFSPWKNFFWISPHLPDFPDG